MPQPTELHDCMNRMQAAKSALDELRSRESSEFQASDVDNTPVSIALWRTKLCKDLYHKRNEWSLEYEVVENALTMMARLESAAMDLPRFTSTVSGWEKMSTNKSRYDEVGLGVLLLAVQSHCQRTSSPACQRYLDEAARCIDGDEQFSIDLLAALDFKIDLPTPRAFAVLLMSLVPLALIAVDSEEPQTANTTEEEMKANVWECVTTQLRLACGDRDLLRKFPSSEIAVAALWNTLQSLVPPEHHPYIQSLLADGIGETTLESTTDLQVNLLSLLIDDTGEEEEEEFNLLREFNSDVIHSRKARFSMVPSVVIAFEGQRVSILSTRSSSNSVSSSA